jgi:sucrose-6-phosphate hydrolase SacC (GH32 family)
MTVPRILSPGSDGSLRIEPVPELEALRMRHRAHRDVDLAAGSELNLDDLCGDCLELAVRIAPEHAGAVGVALRCSPDGEERTAVLHDPTAGKLKVDVSRSTLDESISYPHYRNQPALERLPEEARLVSAQAAPFDLAAGEALELRIFLDRSVLEVFANGRQCITQRIYPSRAGSLGVRVFSLGAAARVDSIQAWDMAPAHD